MDAKSSFGYYTIGLIVAGFGLGALRFGAITEGVIEVIIGLLIVFFTSSGVKKKFK